MPTIPTLSATATPEHIFAAIDEGGGVIVEDFIDPPLLARLQRDFEPSIRAHAAGSTTRGGLWEEFHGTNTKRLTGLAGKSEAWGELLCNPRYLALGDHYLGPNNYYLNTAQLICIGPNETPQLLHRDALNWPEVAMGEHEVTVTALFALTDFTEENGATVVAPGSHRWPGALPEVAAEACTQVVMPAGSAFLYNGKVIHGGGANRTVDTWRVAIHAGFVLGWLRAEENHQLTTPLDVARRLPPTAQQLLGFRSYEPEFGGRLGLVDYDEAARLLE